MHDLSSDVDPSAAGARIARRLVVAGHVQGVSFRWSLRREANRHGVVGWARNTGDGDVEAWLEGSSDAVDRCEVWVRSGGPPSAEVTSVEATEEAPGGLDRFEIRR